MLRLFTLELMARQGPRPAAVLVAALIGVAAACNGDSPRPATRASAPGGVTFVDAAGIEHRMTEPATRIVSLVPSATATLRAIGAERSLVGRTDFDTASWVADLPSVGGGLDPNLEAILALRPDVVIHFHGDQDPRTPARLDELGVEHVAVRPESLQDIYTTNAIIGATTGRVAAADSLSGAIRAALADVAASVSDRPRRTVVFTLGGTPPWVAGPGTYVDEVLAIAGGDNAFDDLAAPWSAVSPEALRTRDIDVVLVPAARSYDAGLTPGARVVEVGGLLDLPGPDVADAARRIAALLRGGDSP